MSYSNNYNKSNGLATKTTPFKVKSSVGLIALISLSTGLMSANAYALSIDVSQNSDSGTDSSQVVKTMSLDEFIKTMGIDKSDVAPVEASGSDVNDADDATNTTETEPVVTASEVPVPEAENGAGEESKEAGVGDAREADVEAAEETVEVANIEDTVESSSSETEAVGSGKKGETLVTESVVTESESDYVNDNDPNGLVNSMPVADYRKLIGYIGVKKEGTDRTYSLVTVRADGSNRQVIKTSKDAIYNLAWSADGKKLAYTERSGSGKLYLYDMQTQTEQKIIDWKGSVSHPSFSPDGSQLLYSASLSGNYDIYLYDFNTHLNQQLTHSQRDELQPSFAPEGHKFVFASNMDSYQWPSIYEYNLVTHQYKKLPIEQSDQEYVMSPRLDNLGKHLSYIKNKELIVQDLQTNETVKLGENWQDDYVAFSPSGDYVVYPKGMNGEEGLVVMSLIDGSKNTIATGDVEAHSPTWSR